MAAPDSPLPLEPGGRVFTTTHWSVVLRAREKDSPDSDAARERLCRTYWPPLYAYIRREGYSVEDAQDLTQEFLSRFLHREWLDHLHDQRGKFRSFLLTFLKHFLSDERDRANALKRGGGHSIVSLDACESEERAAAEPVDGLTADQVFDRRWAQSVMERAVAQLRQEYLEDGKSELFEALKDLQPGERTTAGYAEIGARLGLSEGGVKSAVRRMRQRHRALLHEEIAHTVGSEAEIDEEFNYLIRVLGT